MRPTITCLLVLLTSSSLQAKQFRPVGSELVFSVTEETLESTPAWKPGAGPIPVSAADAIQIASNFQKRIAPDGRTDTFVFDLAGATLIRSDNDRWYWVVQYRVHFDPVPTPNRIGHGWVGPMPKHSRYPVLMNGKLAPHKPIAGKMPAAIQPVDAASNRQRRQ